MILLEEVLVAELEKEGVYASTDASSEPTANFVLINRIGGDADLFGNGLTGRTARERVDITLNVYASSRGAALRLGYQVQEVCRNLEIFHNKISMVDFDGLAEMLDFQQLKAYTFSLSATINQALTA